MRTGDENDMRSGDENDNLETINETETPLDRNVTPKCTFAP